MNFQIDLIRIAHKIDNDEIDDKIVAGSGTLWTLHALASPSAELRKIRDVMRNITLSLYFTFFFDLFMSSHVFTDKMAYVNPSKELVEEIRAIRKDLDYIKTHMVDVDCILTPDEDVRLEKSLEEHREGKTIRLEDFEETKKYSA